jgi:hypothetical protein
MPENMPASFRAVYGENKILPRQRFVVQAARSFRYSPDVQTLVEDFLQYLRHERGQPASHFLFAIRAGRSKV